MAHIAAEMMASASDATVGEVRASFGAQAGDATPKVDVRGVVFDEREHVLLVRERLDGGRWASWKVFLACDIVGGAPAASTFETDEPTFWPVDDPPPLSTGRVTADQLRRLLELHRSPAAGAVFD